MPILDSMDRRMRYIILHCSIKLLVSEAIDAHCPGEDRKGQEVKRAHHHAHMQITSLQDLGLDVRVSGSGFKRTRRLPVRCNNSDNSVYSLTGLQGRLASYSS